METNVNGLVYAGRSDVNLLIALVELFKDERSFYLQSKPAAISDIELWQAGRMFSPSREVRWRRIDHDDYWITALTESEQAFASLLNLPMQAGWMVKPTSLILWGEPKSGDAGQLWVEARIPRILKYPTNGASTRVKIKGLHYIQDHFIQFTRFMEVLTDGTEK